MKRNALRETAAATASSPQVAAKPHLTLVRGGRAQPKTLTISFEVHSDHAPGLLALIEEKSDKVGTSLSAQMFFPRERAYVAAAIGIAKLRAALYAAGVTPDENWEATP